MAAVLVVARPNIDRVWRLSAPLKPGARVSYERIDMRYGGAGLIAPKHEVRLAATLADDAKGRAFHADPSRRGLT